MKTTSKKKLNKNEDDLKKNIFLIPLKFRGKPFLGLAQLSKIYCDIFSSQSQSWSAYNWKDSHMFLNWT